MKKDLTKIQKQRETAYNLAIHVTVGTRIYLFILTLFTYCSKDQNKICGIIYNSII